MPGLYNLKNPRIAEVIILVFVIQLFPYGRLSISRRLST